MGDWLRDRLDPRLRTCADAQQRSPEVLKKSTRPFLLSLRKAGGERRSPTAEPPQHPARDCAYRRAVGRPLSATPSPPNLQGDSGRRRPPVQRQTPDGASAHHPNPSLCYNHRTHQSSPHGRRRPRPAQRRTAAAPERSCRPTRPPARRDPRLRLLLDRRRPPGHPHPRRPRRRCRQGRNESHLDSMRIGPQRDMDRPSLNRSGFHSNFKPQQALHDRKTSTTPRAAKRSSACSRLGRRHRELQRWRLRPHGLPGSTSRRSIRR